MLVAIRRRCRRERRCKWRRLRSGRDRRASRWRGSRRRWRFDFRFQGAEVASQLSDADDHTVAAYVDPGGHLAEDFLLTTFEYLEQLRLELQGVLVPATRERFPTHFDAQGSRSNQHN